MNIIEASSQIHDTSCQCFHQLAVNTVHAYMMICVNDQADSAYHCDGESIVELFGTDADEC